VSFAAPSTVRQQWSSGTERAEPLEQGARQEAPVQQPAAGGMATVLRANRFTPTPWQEVHGTQVRYMLPATLQSKIRQAISQFGHEK